MADTDEPTETTSLDIGDGDADDGAYGDGDCGAQVPMVSVTDPQSAAPGSHRGRRGDGGGGEVDEAHPRPSNDKHVEYVVVVRFDDSYLKTMPGVIRFLQVVSRELNTFFTSLLDPLFNLFEELSLIAIYLKDEF